MRVICFLIASIVLLTGDAEAAALRPAPCWAAAPDEDLRFECATMLTSERPDRADSQEIAIPVLVIRGRTTGRPTVFVEGGPGAAAFPIDEPPEEMGVRLADIAAPFLANGPAIFFEQRGAGRARPSLDCPELDVLAENAAGAAFSDREQQLEFEAARRCRDRLLNQRIDLTAYSTIQIADDVADMVRAFGFRDADLFGVSYGTRVVLEALRRHPGRFRAAALDGAYPMDANFINDKSAAALAALRRFVAACVADRICGGRFPDLGQSLDAVLDRVMTEPVFIPPGGVRDEPKEFNPATTIEALAHAIDRPLDAVRAPDLIDAAARGAFRGLADFAPDPFAGDPIIAEGVQLSVECGEVFAYAARDAVLAGERSRDPFALYAAREPLLNLCASWWIEPTDPRERRPVETDAPILILAGAFDTQTPMEWAERLRRRLPNARVALFGDRGHITTAESFCGFDAAAAFFANPSNYAPPECLSQVRRPNFGR